VKIIICGEGSARDSLSEMIARDGLKNILLLPLQAENDYREMLADIDVALITQQKGTGRAFFPSKLLNALAYARPVLAVADEESELTRVLVEGKFGARVLPGDAEALARKLDGLAASPGELAGFGAAGRKYVERFDRARVFAQFAEGVLRE
ncbi:MAG TPA: glycosyltransferase, partial [Chthoniobacteraceae bacterium]|nr:glycosyltransferase [Chthoniobacteraceae bacterium]